MLLQRQIVSTVDNQLDKDPVGTEYVTTSFHFIAWIFISVNVTIYRTNTLPQGFQNSHFITTAKLRSSI
jgi:hypothetical protein